MSLLDCTISVLPQKVNEVNRQIYVEATCPICLRDLHGQTHLTIQEQHENPFTLVNIILHKVTAVQLKMEVEWRHHLSDHIRGDKFTPVNATKVGLAVKERSKD